VLALLGTVARAALTRDAIFFTTVLASLGVVARAALSGALARIVARAALTRGERQFQTDAGELIERSGEINQERGRLCKGPPLAIETTPQPESASRELYGGKPGVTKIE
jgi:hypothetical protein